MSTPRVVILISGRGSNMLALLDAVAAGTLKAEVAGVLSNRPQAKGLDLARSRGIAVDAIDHGAFETRELFDAALAQRIDAMQIEWIVLAGFMRILSPAFIDRYAGRIVNIHPSLLPAYTGLHTHRRALADGALMHGATVHGVTAELDHGPIIAQAVVPVRGDDDEDRLAARVLEMEHRLYPHALGLLFDGAAAARSPRVLWHPDWRMDLPARADRPQPEPGRRQPGQSS